MTMTSRHILTNIYIPRKTKNVKYEWYEHDSITYFDNLKYKEFAEDTDKYFQEFQLINFDRIHHNCQDNQLEISVQCYRMIRNKDFRDYEPNVQNKAISSAIKSECDGIHFEHVVLKQHFSEKTAIENALISDDFFEKKKQKSTDFTKLKF